MEERGSLNLKSALLGLLLLGVVRANAVDWSWRYRVLRSPHFELIFNEKQRALAKRYLIAAERAHELVFPIFGEGPTETTIVLMDDTDESNGEANFLPYPYIKVYPVLPPPGDELGDYGDWPLEIMVHEYTHILNMYPAHGFYWPFKYIFGTIVRPNAALPKWYLEGLAVDLESALTDHGRLRATGTRAAARALSLHHRFSREDIARINEQHILTWPYGSRPYLYGGWWWETSVQHEEQGTKLIGLLNDDYSRRLPYFIEGPLRRNAGKSAAEVLRATFDRLDLRAEDELKQINRTNPPVTRVVPDVGPELRAFALSPTGRRLAYLGDTPGVAGSLYVKEREQEGQKWEQAPRRTLIRTYGGVQVRFLDEDHLIFDQIDVSRPYVNYRDLYVYDFTSRSTRQLTHGARAQEASGAPSGKQIVFIRNGANENSVWTMNLVSGAARALARSGLKGRFGSPEFAGEDEIIFTQREIDGHERLRRMDIKTREARDWHPELTAVANLRRSGEGWLVSDAGTGVRNVYFLGPEASAKPTPVTNTLTDASQAEYDPQTKDLLTSELTADGRKLVTLPFAPRTPAKVELENLGVPPPPPALKFKVSESSFQPISYLRPRYWIPMIYQVEGGALFQGTTSVADPVGRNEYDLAGAIDTVTRKPSYGITYTNSSLPTRVTLGVAKSVTYLGAGSATLESQNAFFNLAQTWPFNTRHIGWSVGGVYYDTTATGVALKRVGPQAGARFTNFNSPLGSWHGLEFAVNHTEFMKSPGYVSYGRSTIELNQSARLGAGHHVGLRAQGNFAPQLPFGDVIALGDPTVGGNYLVNLVNSSLLMRGYPSANFIGRKVVNGNLEYAFPMWPIDIGFGTKPLFLRNLEIALFADTVGVDGAVYNREIGSYQRAKINHYYLGTGVEFRLATTLAYQLPFQLTLGAYYGTDQVHGGGLSPFVGIGVGALEGLKSTKTP